MNEIGPMLMKVGYDTGVLGTELTYWRLVPFNCTAMEPMAAYTLSTV
jgi:hypothetical protein